MKFAISKCEKWFYILLQHVYYAKDDVGDHVKNSKYSKKQLETCNFCV